MVCDITTRDLACFRGHEGFHGGGAGSESRVGVVAGHCRVNMTGNFTNDGLGYACFKHFGDGLVAQIVKPEIC
ncbi:MAG TPA: hypothetical protein VKV95_03670 [Terriglobia bacterium]|nr:hypothetical protein [Terriglobia bacterium]